MLVVENKAIAKAPSACSAVFLFGCHSQASFWGWTAIDRRVAANWISNALVSLEALVREILRSTLPRLLFLFLFRQMSCRGIDFDTMRWRSINRAMPRRIANSSQGDQMTCAFMMRVAGCLVNGMLWVTVEQCRSWLRSSKPCSRIGRIGHYIPSIFLGGVLGILLLTLRGAITILI